MPIYPYSFQLPPLNVQDIPNDGAPGEFLGINVGGALDWLPAGGGGSGDMLAANNLSELTNFATARTNIGLGTASTPTFANLTLTSPSLSSSAPVTISQTWDAGSNVMTALKVVATDTVSGTTSNLLSLDLSTNNVLGEKWRFKFEKGGLLKTTGNIELGIGLAASSALLMGNGFYAVGGGNGLYMGGGVGGYILNHGATQLWRGSADHILEQRNSSNPQTFNVYGTYTSGSVYERMFMRYTAASTLAFQIGTEQVGATARPLQFSISGSKRLIFEATGVNDTQIYAAGNTARNILALRSLDESGRYQFYINAAGKSELYVGTGVLISEAGSSYFNGGNVGIGTTAPTSNLTVAGTFNFGSTNGALPGGTSYGGHLGSSPDFALRSTSANGTTLYLQNSSSGNKNALIRILGSAAGADHGAINLNTLESSPIIFTTGITDERMRITAAGNVGIGTTSPTSKLHVAGELGTNLTTFDSGAAVKITNTTATGKSWLLTSGIVNIHNEFFCIRQESVSQPALIIAPTTNNVGVGINSPPSKLTVASGDIEVSTAASGLILKSPDGIRYRITVPNGGASLTITAV